MSKTEIKIPQNPLKSFYENKKLSIRKLAKIYNCGATTIQRKLHRYNVRVRPSMSIRLDVPKSRIKFLYEEKRKSTIQLAKIYSCSCATILNRFREYNIKTKDASEAHIKYHKNDFSGDLAEKAYIIGFRIGDLHVRKYEPNGKIISVECASTQPEQVALFHKLFKKYGYVRISVPNRRNVVRMQCALNQSFQFLLKKEDIIEQWILSDGKLFFAFLAGYIDAEGNIGIYSKNTASLRIGSYDKNILSQTQDRLSYYGIESKLNLEMLKGTKINLPRWDKHRQKEYKTRQDFWRLAVYKKKCLLKLFSYVSPYLKHLKKKRSISEARENIDWRNRNFNNLRMN